MGEGLHTKPAWVPWTLLFFGTAAASVSAILIRYANEADALAISFWRCSVGALVLLPFAARGFHKVGKAELKVSILAGVFLAVHFATWIKSLELTSVAAAVLLVSISPVFVAIAARFIFDERLKRVAWIGMGLTLLGTAIIGGVDLGGAALDGNILAVIGGATAGGYILAGQGARRTLGILEYAVIAYSVAAVLLLIACIAQGVDLFGYSARTWWALVGLIVGPQLLGHTVINLVLSEIDATTVAVTIMAEPVIAIVMAFFLFSETPTLLVYPGGALILFGIYLVSAARRAPVQVLD
jgi:drug/metabolite transporter (DMT)-like permease